MFALSKTRTSMPLALIAAVAMTCLQGAAFAGVPEGGDFRTTQVSTSGLNLANPADVEKLDARIERAARSVCMQEDNRDLAAATARATCERASIAAASSKRDVLVARAQSEQMASRVQQPAGTAE
ncbi:UrcA family protein [Sandaracinobacteroides hominis]|uniref:UrcA family protein n=1 Tax=Sandaracinobacteroides hominis TaxID=2780086 RepID=UPI0018F305D9|nr:UrcA family protein [Sandaracinobacteroides hominis]